MRVIVSEKNKEIPKAKVEEFLNKNIHQFLEAIAAEYAKQFADNNEVYISLCTPEAIAAGLLSINFSYRVEIQPGIILTTKKYNINDLEPISFKVNENKLYIYLSPTAWLEAEYCASNAVDHVKKELEGEFNALYNVFKDLLLKHIMIATRNKINELDEKLWRTAQRASDAELQLSLLRQRMRYVINELYGILELEEELEEEMPGIIRDKIHDLLDLLEERDP